MENASSKIRASRSVRKKRGWGTAVPDERVESGDKKQTDRSRPEELAINRRITRDLPVSGLLVTTPVGVEKLPSADMIVGKRLGNTPFRR